MSQQALRLLPARAQAVELHVDLRSALRDQGDLPKAHLATVGASTPTCHRSSHLDADPRGPSSLLVAIPKGDVRS